MFPESLKEITVLFCGLIRPFAGFTSIMSGLVAFIYEFTNRNYLEDDSQCGMPIRNG